MYQCIIHSFIHSYNKAFGHPDSYDLVVLVFVVEYLATQTGDATVNNIFEERFAYTKID